MNYFFKKPVAYTFFMSSNETDPSDSKESRMTLRHPLGSACSGSETQRLSQPGKKQCLYCSGIAYRWEHNVILSRLQSFQSLTEKETPRQQQAWGRRWL